MLCSRIGEVQQPQLLHLQGGCSSVLLVPRDYSCKLFTTAKSPVHQATVMLDHHMAHTGVQQDGRGTVS